MKFENFNKTLKIINVSEEDAGEYVCMANNQLGSIRHSIFVQVKGEDATVPMCMNKYMNLWLCVSPSCSPDSLVPQRLLIGWTNQQTWC